MSAVGVGRASSPMTASAPTSRPASAAFLGERVLVTNLALFSRNPDHYAVLDVFAAEPGLPLFRPVIDAGNPPRIKASARPRRATAGERTCFRFRARLGRGFPLADAKVRFAGDEKATDERGRARMCARLHGGRGRMARVRKPGFGPDRVRIRVARRS